MIDVLPEHVDLILVAGEHLVSLLHDLGGSHVPLAEVEAKREDRREWSIARDVCEKL